MFIFPLCWQCFFLLNMLTMFFSAKHVDNVNNIKSSSNRHAHLPVPKELFSQNPFFVKLFVLLNKAQRAITNKLIYKNWPKTKPIQTNRLKWKHDWHVSICGRVSSNEIEKGGAIFAEKPTVSISNLCEHVCMFFPLQSPLITRSSSLIVRFDFREKL